jgi:hypothetical protein
MRKHLVTLALLVSYVAASAGWGVLLIYAAGWVIQAETTVAKPGPRPVWTLAERAAPSEHTITLRTERR